MDFDFGPEIEEFRKEVRAWLQQELAGKTEGMSAQEEGYSPAFSKKLGAKGWIGIGWPKEYGGQGKSFLHQLAFQEEMGYAGAPAGMHMMAEAIVGPSLMVFGSEEQKKRYLGEIRRGEAAFCMGYTEPHCGSDLAALETRAVDDGDTWLINGRKMFITQSEHGKYLWLAARTDPNRPKHQGISLFIVPYGIPGLSISPVWVMGGMRTNALYLDDVRVPKDALVGELNRGFYQVATALDFERVMIGSHVARNRHLFNELVEFVREGRKQGATYLDDESIPYKLADLDVSLRAARLLAYRTVWMVDRGLVPNAEASATKVFTSELGARLATVGMEILGLYGGVGPSSRWAPLAAQLETQYQTSLVSTVGGGANEIQRNIIATRGLGLPR